MFTNLIDFREISTQRHIYKKALKDNVIKVLSYMENIPNTPEKIILKSLFEGYNSKIGHKIQLLKNGLNSITKKEPRIFFGLPY